MAITYPVDVQNTLWSVYDTQLSAIISRNARWPRADGSPIQGQDARYVMLLQIESAQPTYDPRLYYLESIETPDIASNEILTAYNAVARDVEERKQAATNEESSRLGSIIDLSKEAVQNRLVTTALIRYVINGEALPPKVQQLVQNYANKGVRIWKNRDRLTELHTQLDRGQDPDLDAGWEE